MANAYDTPAARFPRGAITNLDFLIELRHENRASSADLAVEFVKPDSDEAREINRVLLREVDKRRYTATQILKMIQAEGYPRFGQQNHTNLWKELDAKNLSTGYGRAGDYKNTWVWYDSWLDRVRAHCHEHAGRYR